jgi:penicillin amidase
MLVVLATLAINQSATVPQLSRDSYGVPHISASTWDEAFFDAGYAAAEDRLWQMEMSRRLSRGQLAEVLGPKMVAADKETLSLGYTTEELDAQLNGLSDKVKAAYAAYAKGVNAYIDHASASHSLPAGYAENGFAPRPWEVEDSAAIAVRLLQLFGRGGAGELRDLAMLTYLKGQGKVKAKALQVLDDMAWQNDPRAITTMPVGEDPQTDSPPLRVRFDTKQTEKQLGELPKLSVFELLPAIQLSEMQTTKRVAERLNVPFRTGSYCVVVSPERSASGVPLLLSGPQMGHSEPAIIHEMSIEAPGVHVSGMDIPGTPGVVVGTTPDFAWGLTSGVADTEDIFDFKGSGDDGYEYAGQKLKPETIHFTLKVKGEADQTVDQVRTMFGPVVLRAQNNLFVRRSAYRGIELKSDEALFGLYDAKTPAAIQQALAKSSMNFNFFYATSSGHTGWMYTGNIPIRADGLDPRIPTPATPANDWRGFLTPSQMPHIEDPRAGLLANWNNKPAAWWPNFDTPVWGRIFRNEVLLDQVKKPKLTSQDLELAAWNIARIDETAKYFAPYLKMIKPGPGESESSDLLKAYDGRLMEGSIPAALYTAWLNAMRSEVFEGLVGNFYTPDLFRTVIQPSLLLQALERKTKVDYLGTRSIEQVVSSAFSKAVASLRKSKGPDVRDWGYSAGAFAISGQSPVPYSNRGSYIQIIELLSPPYARNILPPGESEAGIHSQDQVPLARAWMYKKMGP